MLIILALGNISSLSFTAVLHTVSIPLTKRVEYFVHLDAHVIGFDAWYLVCHGSSSVRIFCVPLSLELVCHEMGEYR